MPNDLRRAAPSLDDELARLQIEDFSELPLPPFTSSGRLADKRHARVCRPVLQRQKAVLSIEDLDADADDGHAATPVRSSVSRGYRRAASADCPRSSSPVFLSPLLPRECGDTASTNTPTGEAREPLRLRRPSRGLRWPY